MKKLFYFIAIAAILVGCGPKEKDSGSITAVALDPSAVTLVQGEVKRLSIITTPANQSIASEHQEWTSSDETIATVDSKGIVTASEFSTGEVTITFRDKQNDLTATSKVTVSTFYESMAFHSCVLWSYEKDYDTGSGEGDTIGSCLLRIFSNGLFVNSSGYIDGNEGVVINVNTAFKYDEQYYYVLGGYSITDTAFNASQKLKQHCAEVGAMNDEIFLSYWAAMFNNENPSRDDYEYLTGTSAAQLWAAEDQDGYYSMDCGYITSGTFSVDQDPNDRINWFFNSYDLKATLFMDYYGLATEEAVDPETGETGLYVKDPLTVSTQNFEYKYDGVASAPANATKGMTREEVDLHIRRAHALYNVVDTKLSSNKLTIK